MHRKTLAKPRRWGAAAAFATTAACCLSMSALGQDFGSSASVPLGAGGAAPSTNGTCLEVSNTEIMCECLDGVVTGNYIYTFDLTNFSGVDVQYVLLPGGGTSPNIINLGAPLPDGGTTTLSITLIGATANEEFCFPILLADSDVEECCSATLCVLPPECDCFQVNESSVECVNDDSSDFSFTVVLQNLTPDAVAHAFFFAPEGVTISPDYVEINPPLQTCDAVAIKVIVSGAAAGEELCFTASAHDENLEECCSEDICLVVPACPDSPCNPNAGPCDAPNGTPGCSDTDCCELICGLDPFCCDVEWDQICADAAIAQCFGCNADSGPCDAPNGDPGCDDLECCLAVCAEDPFCCDVEWDQLCADQAAVICAIPLPGDLCDDRIVILEGDTAYDTTGYGTDGLAHLDCQFDGQTYHDIWFNFTAPVDGDLLVSTCGQASYDTDLVVYDGCDTLNCPPGDGFVLACNDDGAGCAGFTSEVIVPVLAGQCYKIRVGGWNEGDQGAGTLTVAYVAPPATGACCIDGVCVVVTAADCAAQLGIYQGDDVACEPGLCDVVGPCNPDAGSCDAPNGTPGCADIVCCETICAADPFCCDIEWDQICADAALAEPACGFAAATGACCVDDTCFIATEADCLGQGGVYQGDDTECVVIPPASDCCVPNGTPGCDDQTCQDLICGLDPFCCSTQWDQLCADAAAEQCVGLDCTTTLTCPSDPPPAACNADAGDCNQPNGSPGCNNIECCAAVCAIDPFCCDVEWDSFCVNAQTPECFDPPSSDSACAGDLDGDGLVGPGDLAILMSQWGQSGAADLTADGVVNNADLAALLVEWGCTG